MCRKVVLIDALLHIDQKHNFQKLLSRIEKKVFIQKISHKAVIDLLNQNNHNVKHFYPTQTFFPHIIVSRQDLSKSPLIAYAKEKRPPNLHRFAVGPLEYYHGSTFFNYCGHFCQKQTWNLGPFATSKLCAARATTLKPSKETTLKH